MKLPLKIFKWASASFALIPGLAVIILNVGTPPGVSSFFYGGLIEAFGAFTLLAMFLNRTRIRKMSLIRVNRIAGLLLVLFLIFLLTYVYIYNSQVIIHDKYGTPVFFPFWHGALLNQLVHNAGNEYNAITRYGPQAINDAIRTSNTLLQMTLVIFTLVYVSTFELLIIGFALLGFKSRK
jgi:hypothetical protein